MHTLPKPTSETSKRLTEWRIKALDVFLTTAAFISFPAALIPIAGAFINPKEIPGAIAIFFVFITLLSLAIFKKIDPIARGWALILLGYSAAILDFTRTSLAGDATIYLLAMPLLGFILISPRSGYIAGGISLVLYWTAAFITDLGLLDSILINTDNPFAMRWWIDAGLVFVLVVITLLILFHQFFLLLQKTIESETLSAQKLFEANEQLASANRQLADANDQLEIKFEQRTEKLKESERKLADIINFLPDATVVIDDEGRVVAWNRVMEEITGVKAVNMVGKANYEYATPFYGERRPTLIDLVSRPNEEFEKRYSFIKRDGLTMIGEAYVPNLKDRPAYLFSTASALQDPKGNYAGAIETVRDITDRKQVEEDLRKARDAANTANEAKSTFLASMSHEIRTPMNGIIGMTGLLFDTPLNPEQREFAETIRNSGDSLLMIINDILDFSKIEAGRMDLENHPFDLRDCLESAVDLLALRASEKGLELGVLIDPKVPEALMGDVTRLRQVLVNLLSNAVKFTEKGEILINVNVDSQPESPLTSVHFSIVDTGIGIPASRISRLFQSFSQVDSSTTRKYGGTGLGLAISKRLAELMGGTMWAESEDGKGSVFHFTIQAKQTTILQSKKTPSPIQLQGKRIMIVDDNETNCRILKLQAENWGMSPTVYTNPLEALKAVTNGEKFDVSVLDMHMPHMDGVSLAKEMRQVENKNRTTTPMVMLTSLASRDINDAGYFAVFLTKPVKQSVLYNALVDALSTSENKITRTSTSEQVFDSALSSRFPLRILIAEDNAVNQKLALRIFERLGYRADIAGNGLEVLDALERQPYDLIFMDVQMPEMDGLDATRNIRRDFSAEQQPRIVAMTANAMQGDREECINAGMDDYISKPIQVKEIQRVIENKKK